MSHPLDHDALYHCACGEWHHKHEVFLPPCRRKGTKMAGASRKTKLSKYEVTITREIRHVARLEVDARNAEEAEQMAQAEADEPRSGHWREEDVLAQNVKVKLVRGD